MTQNGYQKVFNEIRNIWNMKCKMTELFTYLTKNNNDTQNGQSSGESSPYIWIHGRKYDLIEDENRIVNEICSTLWFTYRRGFKAIGSEDGPTSDKGWGCMLRCGQMLLANVLLTIRLGRDWTWNESTRNNVYLNIVQKFEDTATAPFSIHRIALAGVSEGKNVGEWFGPNTVSQVLKKLVEAEEFNTLKIHVVMDSLIIKNEICDVSQAESWKPLLLILPVRMGLDDFNSVYSECVKSFFEIEHSVALIGGKPNSALYFIGYCGDDIYYLDPHHTQKSGSIGLKETHDEIELDKTYHCQSVAKMPIVRMNPSLALCFYCEKLEQFSDLCDNVRQKLILSNSQQPLVEVYDQRPDNLTFDTSFNDQSLSFLDANIELSPDVGSASAEENVDEPDEGLRDQQPRFLSLASREYTPGQTRTYLRYRAPYSPQTLEILETAFKQNNTLDSNKKMELSLKTALSPRQVKIWFQNRRTKQRKIEKKKNNNELQNVNSDDFEIV